MLQPISLHLAFGCLGVSHPRSSHQVLDQPAELREVQLAIRPVVVLPEHLDRARHADVDPEVAQRVPQLAVVEETAAARGSVVVRNTPRCDIWGARCEVCA